ncbi:hypothetical protein HK405_009764, partial [Cladochytrium tenue]
MAKLPAVHELITGLSCLASAVCGDIKGAAAKGQQYLDESVIGSLCYSLDRHIHNDQEKAKEALKGCARASGQALCLAGIDMKIPVLHELSAAGRALGHAFANDMESAAHEWTTVHKNESVLGALVASAIEAAKGDLEEAKKLAEKGGRNLAQAVVNVAGNCVIAGATVAAAPVGIAGASAIVSLAGAFASAGANAACTALDGEKPKVADVVGAALIGAVGGAGAGAAGGGLFAKGPTRVGVASVGQPKLAAFRAAVGYAGAGINKNASEQLHIQPINIQK